MEEAAAPRARPWLKWGVEAFSLLASLAFLFAVALYEILFKTWGLSFLQVATPADAIMAGLGILFYASPLLILAGAGALIGFASRRPPVLWWLILVIECALLVLLSVAVGIREFPGAGVIIFLILGLTPLAHVLTHRRRPEVMSRRGAVAAVAALAAASVVAIVVDQVRSQGEDGVGPRQVHLLQPVIPGCHGLVLWQGERATIVECSWIPPAGKDVRVLRDVENLMVTTRRMRHPPTPPKASAER